jgi:hypothetical protein
VILTLELPPKEEAQFHEWAARQGEETQQKAGKLLSNWKDYAILFLKASALIAPALEGKRLRKSEAGPYLLLVLETMTALLSANRNRLDVIVARWAPLEDAMLLYDRRVVSLGLAARVARISQSEFVDALGKAGISVFQYTAEEVLAEADAA